MTTTVFSEGVSPNTAVITGNPGAYGTIAGEQLKVGRPTRSTDLGPIDFAAVARAHGALGLAVEDDASFEGALHEAITSRQTSVIHVRVDRAWLSADEHPLAGS